MAYKQKSGSPFQRNFGIGASPIKRADVYIGGENKGTGDEARKLGLAQETKNKEREALNEKRIAAGYEPFSLGEEVMYTSGKEEGGKGDDVTFREDLARKSIKYGEGGSDEIYRPTKEQSRLLKEGELAGSTTYETPDLLAVTEREAEGKSGVAAAQRTLNANANE